MIAPLDRYADTAIVRGRADCVGAGLQARKAATSLGWTSRRAEELVLVIVELANNAVRHAGGGACEIVVEQDAAVVTVQDGGPGFPVWALSLHASGRSLEAGRPVASSTGLGAGLDCARRLSDELVLENLDAGGARVRAVCRRSIKERGQVA